MRELSIRGVDGPGLHILDVLPESYEGAGGGAGAVAVEQRRKRVEAMVSKPPKLFVSRPRKEIEDGESGVTWSIVKEGTKITWKRVRRACCCRCGERRRGVGADEGDDDDYGDLESVMTEDTIGWCDYCTLAPALQEMTRGGVQRSASDPHMVVVTTHGEGDEGMMGADEKMHVLHRAWSIGY